MSKKHDNLINVFYIPSWYPGDSGALSGIFVKEQIEAIARLAPRVRPIVSLWGHDVGFVNPRSLSAAARALCWRMKPNQLPLRWQNGVCELFEPALTWSNHIPLIGPNDILQANRKSYLRAVENFGQMDIIHAHVSYPAGYVAYLLSKEFGIPYVITEHMGPFPLASLKKRGRLRKELSVAIQNADRVVAVSRSLADDIATYGFKRPVIIANGIDESKFRPVVRPTKPFRFLTVARIDSQKGIELLLRAIGDAQRLIPDAEFIIAGDGPQLKDFKILADTLGLQQRVRWLGAVSRDNIAELFQSSHAFVLPSDHESFGIVYCEGLACGLPIIATRCGGPESIVNEDNGLLVDRQDKAGLVDALVSIYKNYQNYDPELIRADFEQRFSNSTVVAAVYKLYQSILERN